MTSTLSDGLSGAKTERPTSTADVSSLLRDTSGSVLFRGAGTKLGWAGRPDDADLVIDSRDLRGLLTHNAADLTASVSAGTALTALQDELAGDNQWLALDPPTAADGATIGGLLAAGDSGPSRLRYGGLRDLVIGVTLVLADGTLARSGGHVIKNVAGYDLAKLLYGSLGSLAFIAEIVIRLHPRPQATATTRAAASAAQAAAVTQALMAGPLEPTAVEWTSGDSDRSNPDGSDVRRPPTGGELLVRFDGSAAGVQTQTEALRGLLGANALDAVEVGADDAAGVWRAHAATVTGADDETVARIATLPSRLVDVDRALHRAVEESGARATLVSSTALGLHTVRLSGRDPAAVARAMDALRRDALAAGGNVMLHRRPPEVEALLDALGPPPSTAALLRRIKMQFDPANRCTPGRFRPWY
jgi:glycolate oxidase FAD binding subunit